MVLKVYNTLTRQKEPLQTIEPGKVRMYICGPTVYAPAHIGHAMSALVFDVIRRYLQYRGYRVRHVMNFTDVDDKIIQRANQQGIEPLALADHYIRQFNQHIETFHILPATVNPRATQDMPQIIAMIAGLIKRGAAYAAGGDVYFRVRQDADYGKLSGRQVDEMRSGARIEIDERKEDPLDFALWKAAKPGEPAWESPWGPGRPGWHIECSAMNLAHLGEQIDLHGGGNDLIFPHHENEIAQTESLTGQTFARYWVHNGMLQLAGEKMSKSIGNLVTIEQFLEKHEPDALRMMVLNSSYRNPLTYSEEVVGQAESALERLRSGLRPALASEGFLPEGSRAAFQEQVEVTRQGFQEAMDDDFNTAGALGVLFGLVRVINTARDAGAGPQDLQSAQQLLSELGGVLGLQLERSDARSAEAAPFIDLLVSLRSELRKQKLWALSDQVRDQLAELGVVLEDSKQGTTWHWKSLS